MLIGEYRHTIDDKKRLSVPAVFRQELKQKIVITRGLDNCLFVYPWPQWKLVAEKLSNLPMGTADSRSFNRFMLSGAVEGELDSMGRVLIPDFLKTFAGLKTKVVIAGVYNRLEIWDEERWQAHTLRVEKMADTLAEKLGEIGAL